MLQRKTSVLVIGAALVAVLGLAACGGSPASSSAASSSAANASSASSVPAISSSAASASSSSASSSSAASKEVDVSNMAAFKGVDTGGSSVLLAFTLNDVAAADPVGALVVVGKDGGSTSYFGKLDMQTDDQMKIADTASGNSVTVNVVNPTEKGGIIVESAGIGTAELEPIDPQEVLEALKATGLYGDFTL